MGPGLANTSNEPIFLDKKTCTASLETLTLLGTLKLIRIYQNSACAVGFLAVSLVTP